ncbi:hypothetical protein [Rhodothermus marinus]|uniref:hypothetical protein n=1 Tax=Rhodothermus marinus TaxID=29549 RepID=UPI0012BA4590|nr:hypothetical protein [Rhodothermus marinus]BBM71108.1 hypothetical protein RmaAA213_29540 [Rhodothermus marinus]BBM74088.1 hypothetical protein RmaAA338_29530 [Rhodothermus marinus]
MPWIYGLALLLMAVGLAIAVWLIRYANRQANRGGRGFRRPGAHGPTGPRKGMRRARARRDLSRDRRPVPPRLQ